MADAFDPNSNFPFPSPTAPAPGPSLLDDTESRFLDSFFDGVNSDLNYDFFTNAPDGSELGLGWNEVPPTFMGTTTSYGQQPQIVSQHGPTDMSFNGMNSHLNNVPLIQPTPSADLLAAANIFQSTPDGRSQSLNNEALFRGQELSIPPTNGQIRPQSISYAPPPPRSNTINREPPAREDSSMDIPDTYYADVVFGRQVQGSSRPRQLNKTHSKADIKWGSDTSFNAPEGFIPPLTQRKEMAKIDFPFQVMEENFIDSTSSAENSRAASPTTVARPAPPAKAPSPKKRRFTSHINYSEDEDTKPMKTRKNKFQNEDDDDDSPASAGTKRRKSNKDSPVSDQNSKRRKSSAAATAKAARENLTEDQKRENHIKSEQKRRTLIREGFEDLGELVPGLRGGGFSKSAVLIMSADWLEELIRGNEVLQQRLAQLQSR